MIGPSCDKWDKEYLEQEEALPNPKVL